MVRNLNRAAWFGIGLALGFAAKWAVGQTPGLELRAALADARTLSATQALQVRYVTAFNLKDIDAAQRTLNFVCNSVSRSATLRAVTPVAGSGGRLLRFDLAAFGIPHAAWESLTADDPYFKIKTQVIDPHTGKKKTVVTDGGWVNLEEAAALRTMTGSTGAICRLDWFIAKVVTPPHYYSMAGVPETVGEWYKQLGADKDKIVALRANHGANLFTSGVTKKPRRISRYAGPLGAVWQTYDTEGTDPLKDPIRNPSFESGFDASELIAAKQNGMLLYLISNANGKRQDVVPDKIAKDDSDPHGDGRLVPMISCVRCHAADGGLRSFTNDTADMMERGIDILTGSPFDAESLASFYLSPKLQRDLQRDREDYAAAVARSTNGWTPKQAAAALAEIYAAYEYRQVTPEAALRELGSRSLDGLRGSRDGVLLGLLSGHAVQRRQFEASFAEAAILCGGK